MDYQFEYDCTDVQQETQEKAKNVKCSVGFEKNVRHKQSLNSYGIKLDGKDEALNTSVFHWP